MHQSKYRGVVKGISEDWEDPLLLSIQIELPKKKGKKTSGGGPTVGSEAPTRSETVSLEMGQTLKIGDPVEVSTTLRKIRQVTRKKK